MGLDNRLKEMLDSKKDTKMIDFPVKKYILFGKNIIMIFKNVITFFMENNYVFKIHNYLYLFYD